MNKGHVIFLSAMGVWSLTLFAQSLKPITILEVNVEGNHTTAVSVIKYASGLVEGAEIIPGDFGNSVKKLWDTGIFSDVQIWLDEETPEGITLTIKVQENPVLGKVKFKGNKARKWKDYEEKLSLKTGQRLTPSTAKESIEKIKDIYAEDGYLRAEVRAELSDGDSPGNQDLSFHIRENKKVKIASIRFENNQTFSDRKLRRQFKNTKPQKWYLFWRSPYDRKKFQEDKNRLSTFYKDRGYRDFHIVSDTLSFSPNGKKMFLNIRVYEGLKYYFRNLTTEGNLIYSESALLARSGLKRGQIYDEAKFNQAVFERMHGLYLDNGYIFSQITPEIVPFGEDSLDVHFAIVENSQVSVRQINVVGNKKTRENVIRRELQLVPGDIFNRELLMRSARELWILNYFSNVVPDVVPVDEDEVDVVVTVEEKSSDQLTASLGYNEQIGLTGGAGVEFTNFMGRGQQLNLSYQEGVKYRIPGSKSPKYRSFSFSFVDPMVKDTPNLLGASAYYSLYGQNSLRYDVDEEGFGGSLRWGRRFKWPDNYFRGTWIIQGSKRNYRGREEDLNLLLEGLRVSEGIGITQLITRDSRDHPEFPSGGSRVVWTSTLSGGILWGNESYHKHEIELNWYTSLYKEVALVSEASLGAIKKLPSRHDRISVIPLSEKFVMGGSGLAGGTMLRGYEENSVGPYAFIGGRRSILGGNVLLKYTTELRLRFSKNPTIYGLVFAEMGNVWKEFSETHIFDLKRSAGGGVRMFMPMIGMIGFDYGYGFDDLSETGKAPEGWKFHLLFGMPF